MLRLYGDWNSGNKPQTKKVGFQHSFQIIKKPQKSADAVSVQEVEHSVLIHGTKFHSNLELYGYWVSEGAVFNKACDCQRVR